MVTQESKREYSQDNIRDNFESQEAQKVINEAKSKLLELKNDITNKNESKETKGWDANEALKASEYLGRLYTIKKEKVTVNWKTVEKEKVYFDLNNVKDYLQTVYNRLTQKWAPGYGHMSKESTFNWTILAVQIALESINRKNGKWSYDVWTINWQLNDSTKKAVRDFQRDYIWGKGIDGKPGKNTIWMILKKLKEDKPETADINPGSTKRYSNPNEATAASGNIEYETSTPTTFCWIELNPNAKYDVPGLWKDWNRKLTKKMWVWRLDTIVEHNWKVIRNWWKHKETYYSETVLPWGWLKIPGRHVAEDGTIRDKDGYIVVAADLKYAPRDSLVMTTLGPGKVYDTWVTWAHFDIYVNSRVFK